MIKLSRKAKEYLIENKYKKVVVALETDCSCAGNYITGTNIKLYKRIEEDNNSYNMEEVEGIVFCFDKRFNFDSRLYIYLSGSVENVLEIEGLEVK